MTIWSVAGTYAGCASFVWAPFNATDHVTRVSAGQAVASLVLTGPTL